MSRPLTASTGRPPDCTIAIQRAGRRRAHGALRHAALLPSSTTGTAGVCGRDRQALLGRHGCCRSLLRIRGPQHPRDPCRAFGAEAIGELAPRVDAPAAALLPDTPVLLPVVDAPRLLVRREIALVRIEVDLVGIDAHAQFAAAVGLREEPRFEPHGKQRQRPIARANRASITAASCGGLVAGKHQAALEEIICHGIGPLRPCCR